MFLPVNSTNSPHFGVLISTKTVRRANQATIERGREARRRGLSLAEYQRLHKEDYVHRIGGKTYDFYAIGKKIMSDKEKLKKAFSDAWNKIITKKG